MVEHSLEDCDLMRLGYSGGNIEKLIIRIKIFNNRHVQTVVIMVVRLHNMKKNVLRNLLVNIETMIYVTIFILVAEENHF